MTRLKLFLFYTAMAWASLIQPRHGKVMIDAAQRDADRITRERLRADIHQNGRTGPAPEVQSEASIGIALFGAIAALSTVGWVCILVSMALGWSE